MTTLTTTLRTAIERDGRSLYQIAKAAGVALPVLSRFVRSDRTITLETADKIAGAIGLKLPIAKRA